MALHRNLPVFVYMDYNVGFVDARLYCLTYGAVPLVPSQTFTVWHAAQCSLLFHFDMGDGACILFQGLRLMLGLYSLH